MGVVSISPVVIHYWLLYLPIPFPSLSFFCTSEAAAVCFLRATALFETKPQMGLFKAFRGPLNGRNYAKSNLVELPFSHARFPQLVIICIPLQTVGKHLSNPAYLLSRVILSKMPSLHLGIKHQQRSLEADMILYKICLYESPCKVSPAALLCNGGPRRRRLSPWKQCLT